MFTRMICYVASYYHHQLRNNTIICPKIIKDLPKLAEHLAVLARKVADMNITKDERKAIMAEFPREYTNLSTLSQELLKLCDWHSNGMMGNPGSILWEPGLDEMEFYDSADDLSDHLPRDSEYESSIADNFDTSEDEDYGSVKLDVPKLKVKKASIDVRNLKNPKLILKAPRMSSPVINEKRQPVLTVNPYSDVDQISKVHKLPSTTDAQNLKTPSTVNQPLKAIMKMDQIPPTPTSLISKDEHIKEVQQQKFIQKFKLPVPKIIPSSTTAPKRKSNKDKLKGIMNGLKRSKY